jgi:hypothetical protein
MWWWWSLVLEVVVVLLVLLLSVLLLLSLPRRNLTCGLGTPIQICCRACH